MTVLSAVSIVFVIFLVLFLVGYYINIRRNKRVPILMYHRLYSERDQKEKEQEKVFVVSESAFEDQMAYLHRNGFTSIDLDDFIECAKGRQSLPKRPVIITFDDGYLSVYKYAYPILKKYGFTATVFVTVDKNAKEFDTYRHCDPPLTNEQIIEMSENGISIQSHAISHRPLSELSPNEIWEEVTESKRLLKELTGKPVDFFAAPGSFYNDGVKELVKRAGYKGAFFGPRGGASLKNDLHSLRRINVERGFTVTDFARCFNPFMDLLWMITGTLKGLPLKLVGPRVYLKARTIIYKTSLGYLLTFRVLGKLILGIIAVLFLFGIYSLFNL